MSKYETLWMWIKANKNADFDLSFDEIEKIIGFKIDHSLLTYKKELQAYGFNVYKIEMKNKIIHFKKI